MPRALACLMISAVESSPSPSSISKITTPKNLLSDVASGSVKVSQNVVIATITAFSRRERARVLPTQSYWPIAVCISIQAQVAALVWNGPASKCSARPTDTPTQKKWRVVVCARPLIQDERDELVCHRVPRHNTFGRSGQIVSQRSWMLCASRRGQSPLSCSLHFIILPRRPYFAIRLGLSPPRRKIKGQVERRFRVRWRFRFLHLAFWLRLSFARDALVHLRAIWINSGFHLRPEA